GARHLAAGGDQGDLPAGADGAVEAAEVDGAGGQRPAGLAELDVAAGPGLGEVDRGDVDDVDGVLEVGERPQPAVAVGVEGDGVGVGAEVGGPAADVEGSGQVDGWRRQPGGLVGVVEDVAAGGGDGDGVGGRHAPQDDVAGHLEDDVGGEDGAVGGD